ncbi:MAG: ATP-binding protein, partial [Candidatus Binatia bacterium]
MKCTRCRERAEINLRSHNSAFCKPCFILYFQRQVERTIAKEKMFTPDERILVAVSGGKDSLALWDVLLTQGYHTEGLYLDLGIGTYSSQSREKAERFAQTHAVPLRIVPLAEEAVAVPTAAQFTRRVPCAACGTMKRHFFDQAALEGGFDVLATGHNLDDEAARLLGNVLHWQTEYLAREKPVLAPTHPRFVRKVRPLY